MHSISTLGWVSFILAILSYGFGAFAIVNGPARPSVISRFFWLVLSITNILSYLKIGAGSGIFLALANSIGSATIFLLSLRFGFLELKKTDWLAIIGSSMALFCYIFLKFKLIALAAGLLTHFISGLPTFKKTWRHPESEDLAFWALFAIASLFSLIGVLYQHKSFIYPAYFLLFDAGMTLLILLRRSHRFSETALVG